MFYVPLYIEAVRSRPVLVFWLATLAQAALWILVPTVFYAAPPGVLPQVLAIGHEFPLRGDTGPPLAYWLAEIAFRVAGLFGVYLLSQACVIATYWCVFALGRAIVGATHAVIAVLLMVGVSVFTVPTPDFGPPILTMALWAAALLYYWRAVMQGKRRSWYLLGVAAALILLTSNAALILLGLLGLFTVATERGRASLGAIEPRIVAGALLPLLAAHLFWLAGASDRLAPVFERLRITGTGEANTAAWLRLLVVLILAHAGIAILTVLASGRPRFRAGASPAIPRLPVDPFAVTFVTVFALLPVLLTTTLAVLLGRPLAIGSAAPLLILSGLAVIIAAGDSFALYHQRVLGYAWAGLLIVPAIFVPIVLIVLPWTVGADLKVAQPAAAMGRFFAESFERRTGHPLAVVSGDVQTATLVALAAPSRPSVYFDADPARAPRVTIEEIRERGAVVVWPAASSDAAPPPEIAAHFPGLIPEVPQTFARQVRGRLPPLRIGWGMIRPANAAAAAR
ncbi:MAG: glycosyltransferase family 39 protein [Xanthobacteraceae bacterium]